MMMSLSPKQNTKAPSLRLTTVKVSKTKHNEQSQHTNLNPHPPQHSSHHSMLPRTQPHSSVPRPYSANLPISKTPLISANLPDNDFSYIYLLHQKLWLEWDELSQNPFLAFYQRWPWLCPIYSVISIFGPVSHPPWCAIFVFVFLPSKSMLVWLGG